MRIQSLLATLFVASVSVMMLGLSCSPIITKKITFEEANEVLGAPVPKPSYLPDSYGIREIYSQDNSVLLLISDKEIKKKLVTYDKYRRYEFESEISLQVTRVSEMAPHVRLPTSQIKINESTGYLQDRGDSNALWWNWDSDRGIFELVLSATKEIPIEELVKIAESVGW